MPRFLRSLAVSTLALGLSIASPALAQEAELEAEVAQAPVQPPEGPSPLVRAYQKEVAFLLSERAALQTRLQASEADGQGRIDAAKREVEGLQGRLLTLQREADSAEELLDDADDGSRKALESNDLVGSTLAQAQTSLNELGVDVPPAQEGAEANAEALAQAFGAMTGLITDGGSITSEEGAFFLADGTRTEGTLVKVGRVATYGVSDQGSGALAPAGQGRLRLAANGDPEVAKAHRA